MKNIILIFIVLLFCSVKIPNSKEQIVGIYYIAAYSKEDFKGKIYLKKNIPINFDSIYKGENDVDKIVEFKSNNEIIFREFPNAYFCGDPMRIELENGNWRRINQDEFEISWLGKSAYERFEIKSKYRIKTEKNGDKVLMPI
jgi:hypothetical protein